MTKPFFTITLTLLTLLSTFGQDILSVTEQTIKIGGNKEEELYYGFAEGDKIVFSFEEVDGKELQEIEIIEYPSNSKFSDFKTALIKNKTINVTSESVYVFRFKNSKVKGKICRIKIERIPANNDTKNFNSTVTWETKQETTYNTYTKDIVVGYDTIYTQKTKRLLVNSIQKEELIFEKPQRVHSITNGNGNRTSLFFTLPQDMTTPYQTSKVVAWAYWVGVGEESNEAWKQNAQIISNVAKGAATVFTSPLGALAVGAVTDLMLPKNGEDVYYAISDQKNKDLFMNGYEFRLFDQGKGVAGYRKFTDKSMCQGTYFILLSNDNVMQGIDANVKVIAIIETNIYEDQEYTDIEIKPRFEKKTFSDPIIKTYKIPVISK